MRSNLRALCCALHNTSNAHLTRWLHSPDLTQQIQRWGLQNAGFDYDIVAVFGSQSTGKSMCGRLQRVGHSNVSCRYTTQSVIRNQLRCYGRDQATTDHQGSALVIQSSLCCSDPTLGIWMCRAKGMNVMVMDVEGTDGRERGEDQVCVFPQRDSKYLC